MTMDDCFLLFSFILFYLPIAQERIRPGGVPFNEANPSYTADQDIWGRTSADWREGDLYLASTASKEP